MEEKEKVIEDFLSKLGKVEGADFTIICNKCQSTNVLFYDDTGCGSEYTGCWGSAGIKCKDCGNAKEVFSN